MPDKPRKQSADIRFRTTPELARAFDEYCDRTQSTKSDILREYISFLIEHPELGSGREALEKMFVAYKASSPGEGKG